MIQNMKQDICSIYFFAAILLTVGVCLLSPGIGILDLYGINRPMLIEELFLHNKEEFAQYNEIYDYIEIFQVGIHGHLFAFLPLLSMSSINRYCEEKTSGFWIQKTFRLGRQREIWGHLIASAVVANVSLFSGLAIFMILVIFRLPLQNMNLLPLIPQLIFICLLTILGTFFSMIIAALTKNRFYAFIIPVLFFYAENEFLLGLKSGMFSSFSIQKLMNPQNWGNSLCFILIGIAACCQIIHKIERSRWSFHA